MENNSIKKNILSTYGQAAQTSTNTQKSTLNKADDNLQNEDKDEVLKSEFSSDEDALDFLEKALDTSRLRRVRTMVRRRDGTVYQKTVYKKEEELEPEARRAFMAQDDLEQMGHEVAGKRVTAKWVGSATGAKYECDWLEVDSINDQNIVLKFTQDFQTNNRSNYVYRAGSTINIPRTNNPSWSKDNSVKLTQVTTTTTQAVTRRTGNQPISNFSDISVGDEITIKENGVEKKVTVRRLNVDRTRGYQFIGYADESGTIKLLKFGKRGVELFKQGEQQAPESLIDKLSALKSQGLAINVYGVPTRIANGTTTTTERVRVDRFGNRNPRGSRYREMPVERTSYRDLSPQERIEKEKEILQNFQYKEKLNNFNFEELTNGFVSEFRNVGIDLRKEDVKFSINPGSNTMELNVDKGGVEMTRTFYFDQDKVYHNYFKVGDDRRGDGLGKKLFKNLYKQYRNIGIKKITVSANIDTGCYAWSAYGFSASSSDADTLIRHISAAAGRGRSYSVQQKGPDGVKRMVQYRPTQQDAANMRRVYDEYYSRSSNLGKTIPVRLLTAVAKTACQAVWPAERASWAGSLDLTKDSERVHFENYIGFNS